MAWRSYVDPKDNQTWWTDDKGNWVSDTQWQRESQPAATSARSPYTVSMPGANSMQMVGGLEQLALQIPQLQQEYQRQRLQEMELPVAQATLSGYLPKAWSQAQQGRSTQAGGEKYNTANGPKTLQQMRDEIVAASRA